MNPSEFATSAFVEIETPSPDLELDPLVPVNVASVKHRSPFRYPGGKTWLVPHVRRWLWTLNLPIERFVEPFAGGAIVGLSALLDRFSRKVTLIEKDINVASVWQTIANGGALELAKMILSFEMTEENVQLLLAEKLNVDDILGRAFVTIVRNRVQRGGIIAPGASVMKAGEQGRGIGSRWYPETLRKRLEHLHALHSQIDFVAGDGIAYMREHSSEEEIVWFVDPPYTVAGRRLYVHSEINHEELFSVASTLVGPFLMTYDDSEEIRTLADRWGFCVGEVAMKNSHHALMKELLISRDLGWL